MFGAAILFILFGWLHLILSLQIASTGRQIQIANDNLDRVQRENMALANEIAAAEAQESMSVRAKALGYGPHTPLYLPVVFDESATNALPTAVGGDIPPASQEASSLSPMGRFLLDATHEGWTTVSSP